MKLLHLTRTSLCILLLGAFNTQSLAVTYIVSFLPPPGIPKNTMAFGASVGNQVGMDSDGTGNGPRALVWNAGTNPVQLHPTGYSASQALAVSGATQVGHATPYNNLSRPHAMMWTGSAASAVDLNPIGFDKSIATGVSDDIQVGWVESTVSGFLRSRAIMWQGTSSSAVDLMPTGATDSRALATSGGSQVGYAGLHAALWSGTAASYIDLHPPGSLFQFGSSFAEGVSGNVQVGQTSTTAARDHAAMWRGSAATYIDLNPVGYTYSEALGTNGDFQVGYGYGTTFSERALLWSGSAASAIDLHQFLASTGRNFSTSRATGIAADGTIVGHGRELGVFSTAIMWTPVAESGVPGDYNNDGTVDTGDYVAWRKGNNPLYNEVTTIGSNTPADYTEWRARFGNPTGNGASIQSAVPEPSTFVLAVGIFAPLAAYRRRRA